MFAQQSQAIHDLLRDEPWLAPDHLEQASTEAQRGGRPLADVLCEKGFCEKTVLLEKISQRLGHEFLPDVPRSLPDETVAGMPSGLAHRYGVIPWRNAGDRLDLLTRDPFNDQTVDDLTFALEREVRLVVADPDRVDG